MKQSSLLCNWFLVLFCIFWVIDVCLAAYTQSHSAFFFLIFKIFYLSERENELWGGAEGDRERSSLLDEQET